MDVATMMLNLARFIVEVGANIQVGQIVRIYIQSSEQLPLARLIADLAMERGARRVLLEFSDPAIDRSHIVHASDKNLGFQPKFIGAACNEILDTGGVMIQLKGMAETPFLENLDPTRKQEYKVRRQKPMKALYEALNAGLIAHCIVPAATKEWAEKLRPELYGRDPEAAIAELWMDIFYMLHCDQPDCIQYWRDYYARMKRAKAKLQRWEIDKLIYSGPGFEIEYGLPKGYLFSGGPNVSKRNRSYLSNLGTSEMYCFQDHRRVNGKAVFPGPLLLNSDIVENVCLWYKNGVLTKWTVGRGKKAFKAFLDFHPGHRLWGEIAIVLGNLRVRDGAPKVWYHQMLDEWWGPHAALGKCYTRNLVGGEKMSKKQIAARGGNIYAPRHFDLIFPLDSSIVAVGRKEHLVVDKGDCLL